MSYLTTMQQISAGNQFDGTAPTGSRTGANGKFTFPEEAAGGLFDVGPTEPGHLIGVQLYAAGAAALGASSWSVTKVTAEGDEVSLFSGTTETQFVSTSADRVPLLPGEKIKVVTAGATAALRCMVMVDYDLSGGTDG